MPAGIQVGRIPKKMCPVLLIEQSFFHGSHEKKDRRPQIVIATPLPGGPDQGMLTPKLAAHI